MVCLKPLILLTFLFLKGNKYYNKNKTINNVSTSIISSSIIPITIIVVNNNITSNTIITESNNYNKEIIGEDIDIKRYLSLYYLSYL